MPSCIVKTCKNNTKSHKKSHGTTFHLVPSRDEEWRENFIDVIRESRGDRNWLPSKCSAICSAHFDTKDLYTTKGGLLRIVKYAVPTKLLYEPHQMRKEQSPSPYISNVIEEVTIGMDAEASSFEQPVKIEPSSSPISSRLLYEPHQIQKKQSASPYISNATEEITIIGMDAEASSFEQQVKIEPSSSPIAYRGEEPVLPNISNAIQTVSIVMNDLSFEQPVTKKQFSSPSTSFILTRNLPEIGTATTDINLEQPLSTLNTPMERRLKRSLMKAQTTVQNQKKKIKTLNQKIRRLVNRNHSLKLILKNIFKEKSSRSCQHKS